MRILIVMAGFFPGNKYGGPPVSVDNFCSLMKDQECYIVTSNHDLFEKKKYINIQTGWNDRGNCLVLYLSDDEYRKAGFKKVIEEIHPDIIYLQGLFQSCVFPCLQLAKKYKIKVLLAPRGELCANAFTYGKWKKIPYIYVLRIMGLVQKIHFQSTSDEETKAISRWLKADKAHTHFLSNIPSIPRKQYSRREKKAGEGRFIFLSRIHPKKNLRSAIHYFQNIQGKAIFDIYGPIEDEEYWKQCRDEIKMSPANIKVKYKGLVKHDQVHEVFSQYDAFLFPTLSENFGHVIAESLVVGTPVIISDQTPWNDVNEAGAGWAVKLDDSNLFCHAIQTIVEEDSMQEKEQSLRVKRYVEGKLKIDYLKSDYSKVLFDIIT